MHCQVIVDYDIILPLKMKKEISTFNVYFFLFGNKDKNT